MNPSEINDKELGRLIYEKELDWYTGQIVYQERQIAIHLSTNEDGDVQPALMRAVEIVARVDEFARAAEDYAAAMLLELKNDSWLDEDEEPLDAERFKDLMTLESIVFYEDGVTFYHNDGDLFWGHSIEIGMDGENNFNHADIPG